MSTVVGIVGLAATWILPLSAHAFHEPAVQELGLRYKVNSSHASFNSPESSRAIQGGGPPLVCPTGIGCQLPDQMEHGGFPAVPSDLNPIAGTMAADNFTTTAGGNITSLCWWGMYIDWNTNLDCSPGLMDDFSVTYYDDDAGGQVPGSILAGPLPLAPANKFPTGNLVSGTFLEWQFEGFHDPVPVLPSSCYWVEISNNTPAGNCTWWWSTAPPGDGSSVVDGLSSEPNGVYESEDIGNFDLGWCVDEEIEPDGCSVCAPPVIAQQPQSQIVCENEPFSLSVEVEGTGPFSYFWCFEDVCGIFPDSPTVEVDSASLGNGGVYFVEVSGPCGIVLSDSAEVNVHQRCQLEPPRCPPATADTGGNCDIDNRAVHLFSGEFTHPVVDLRVPGRGLDFVWSRRYRSGVNTGFSRMGNQWDFSYNIRLQPQGNSFLVWDGNTRKDLYKPQPDGTWRAEEYFRVLEQNPDSSYTLTFEDTGTWNFNGLAQSDPYMISSICDRNGNCLTFDYNVNGWLETIHDTLDTPGHNRDITIAYNVNGRIESVTDWTGRQVLYEYYDGVEPGASFGDLKSVRTPVIENTEEFPIPPEHGYPDGKTTVYTYTSGFADDRLNHDLLTITDPKGQTFLINEYAHTIEPGDPRHTEDPGDLYFDRLVRQTWGDPGDISDMVYVPVVPDAGNHNAVVKSIVNDRAGNISESLFDELNRLVIQRDYTGRWDPDQPTFDGDLGNPLIPPLRGDDPTFFETRRDYNPDSRVVEIVRPNGNIETLVYDEENASRRAQGNLLQHCRAPGTHVPPGDQDEICELFEYDDGFGGCCGTNFVIRHTDGRGNDTIHEYDASGNRINTQHPIPSIVEDFEYNAFGQITLHVLPDNGGGHQRQDQYSYYDSGPQQGYLQNEIIDADNLALTTTYEYDVVGNLTRLIDPRGNDTLYAVNQLNQVVRETSREVEDGSSVRYQREWFYDPNDYVIRIDIQNKDDSGSIVPENPEFTTTYEYDIINSLTRQIREVDSEHDIVTEFEYDDNRNRTLVRDGEATSGNDPFNTVRSLYDERDLLFRQIRGEGSPHESSAQYDYDGNVNVIRTAQGLEGVPRVTIRAYDGYDRLFAVIDPMGNRTEYHYDPNGNVGGDQAPGMPNPFGIKIFGEIVDVEEDAGNEPLYETTYEYDVMNRMTRQVTEFFDTESQNPLMGGQQLGKSITQAQYSDNSQLVTRINDNLHSTTISYDTASRILSVVDAKNNSTTYTYDPNSNLIEVHEVEKSDLLNPDEEFTTTYEYDNINRLTRTVDNVGNSRNQGYDSRNNRTVETDALGHQTRYVYDGIDRLTRTTHDLDDDGADGDGSDIVTIKLWDDSSRLSQRLDDNLHATTYEYDSLNRLTRQTFADGTEQNFAFDVHDNPTSVTDANGTEVLADHDLLNRVISRTVDRASIMEGDPVDVLGTTIEIWQYDGLSRVVSAQDDDALVSRSYDSLSRVISETLNGQTTTTVHDGMGNPLSCTYPGGRTINGTFDPLERQKNVSDANGLIAGFAFVGPGRVERMALGDGTQADYSYDGVTGVPNAADDFGVKQIIETAHSRTLDGLMIDQLSYKWDPMFNKSELVDERMDGPGLTTTYEYDPIYRLTRTMVTDPAPSVVRDEQHTMDGVQNRVDVVGGPHPGAYTMDPALPEPADEQMNQYTITPFDQRLYDLNGNLLQGSGASEIKYDYRNRMVEYVDVTSGQSHTYAYDALGRRIAKVVDADGAADETRFFYDGWQVIEEQNGTNETQATYVYGIYIDEVLSMQRDVNGDAVPEDYYYHSDEHYSVAALTAQATPAFQWSDSLDSYAPGPLVGLGGWAAWDNDPAASNFEVSFEQSQSPPHAIKIDGTDDAVRQYADYDSGTNVYSAWQYIPADFESGDTGPLAGTYFILLNTYNIDGPYHWSAQMQFDSNDGLLKVWQGDGSNTVQVPYETDRWVKIQVIVDLEDDWTRVYYDDELITEYPWTGGIYGSGGGVPDIAAVDLYANDSTGVYYDDLRLDHFEGELSGSVVERYAYHDYGEPKIIGTCQADVGGDGTVGIDDLLDLLAMWGPCPGCPADVNGDEVVNIEDLLILLGGWGECAEPPGIGNPYRFTGRRFDEETGWYYYRTRYLDPIAGRFTTRDMIGIWGDSSNLGSGYAYAGNNPLSAVDPYGLQSDDREDTDSWDWLVWYGKWRQAQWEALPESMKFRMCAGFKPKTGWDHFVSYYLDPDQHYRMCYNRWKRGQVSPSGPSTPGTPPKPGGGVPSQFSGSCYARCLAENGIGPGDDLNRPFLKDLSEKCKKKCSKPSGPSGPTGPTRLPLGQSPEPGFGPYNPTPPAPSGGAGPTGPSGPTGTPGLTPGKASNPTGGGTQITHGGLAPDDPRRCQGGGCAASPGPGGTIRYGPLY